MIPMPLTLENARRQLREVMKEKKIGARSAFKRLSLKYHPNKGGSVANQQTLQKALNTINAPQTQNRTRSETRSQTRTYNPGNYGWIRVDSEFVKNRPVSRIVRKVKSKTGKTRVVSRRCRGEVECILAALMNITKLYEKRRTPNYYKDTKCSMKKVRGAKTKTGRKCVGKGQTTETQIAARRAYDKKFIRWYRKGMKGSNPAKQAAAYYAATKKKTPVRA
ncbi:hypothetical protein DSLPV1_177 [Dishui lake phycodnavirus 1]|uniref:hypothetical protein n=1 Tax=Dishui lake phycodnavirus 1 TaxID=2079134 RepID=UPI000CD67F63|nr:hypothetical protein C5Y57_gp221 [Dishui lake phycodnavirus 1]AUT19148.1 hypothetical protein DSLPV1_177 [Dishui lake phycodnavirus 1]